MGGLAGGLFAIFELIGEVFYVFLIGWRRARRQQLRTHRVVVGGIIFGFGAAVIIGILCEGSAVSIFCVYGLIGGFLGLFLSLILFGYVVSIEREEANIKRQEAERQKREELKEIEENRKAELEARLEEWRKKGIFSIHLEPGLEVFSPIPLSEGQRYKIVVTGVYKFRRWGWKNADACFYVRNQNFDQQYKGIFFDSKPVNQNKGDRDTHIFSFEYIGTGQKLSVLLKPPLVGVTQGGLDATITPAPVKESV